jgi:hypothetical protein
VDLVSKHRDHIAIAAISVIDLRLQSAQGAYKRLDWKLFELIFFEMSDPE